MIESSQSEIASRIPTPTFQNNFVILNKSKILFTIFGRPQQLQKIQYSAAKTHKDHITSILMCVHWLSIKYRIQYKSLTLIFKVNNLTV